MLQTNGFTLWLTGMSSSGKSTLAHYLGGRFRAIGRKTEVLDHDDIGPVLTKELGPTKEERHTGMERLGFVAKLLTRNDCIAIAAAVSPHREARDHIRKEIGRFVEVFVDCPTETLIERDTKGLYKKARAGQIRNFTGVSAPYESPEKAELVVQTDRLTVKESVAQIVDFLKISHIAQNYSI
jgi:adenylylsulfate kinase